MNKKFKIILVNIYFLSSGMVPQVAFSADFCSEIKGVVSLAPDNFSSIRLQQTRSTFKTSIQLPHASRCWIRNDAYWCTWQVDSRSQLKKETGQFFNAISKCYPNSATESKLNEDEPYGFVETDTAEIYVAADKDDVSVEISIKKK